MLNYDYLLRMVEAFATTIALLALGVSCLTAWLTLFRRGTIKMTRPMVIYFGPDGGAPLGETAPPKVFLRTLLFSTSKRGRVIESMHLTLTRNETRQNFNIWVYGVESLVRGSGLFVDEAGLATNHHFLVPNDGSPFKFNEGTYTLVVHAKLLGDASQIQLLSQRLEISPDLSAEMDRSKTGLYFDWGPDSERYHPNIPQRLPEKVPVDPFDLVSQILPPN